MLAAIRRDGAVRLEQRPAPGIWGGLWCLPEFPDAESACSFAEHRLGGLQGSSEVLAPIRHVFTHFELSIIPVLAHCRGDAPEIVEPPQQVEDVSARARPASALWYHPKTPPSVGLPAPVRALVEQLAKM